MIKTIIYLFFIFSVFLGCDNTHSGEEKINKSDSTQSINLETDPTALLTDTTISPSLEKKKEIEEPELYVVEMVEKDNENFEKYYSFKIRNNTTNTLKSFKFSFKYELFSINGEKSITKYENVVIKNNITPGETFILNVDLPQALEMKKALEEKILIYKPYLYGAIDAQGNTILTEEGVYAEMNERLEAYRHN